MIRNIERWQILCAFLWAAQSIFVLWASAETLTRVDALNLMRSHGNRWRQADTVLDEARAKTWLAWSAILPQVELSSRQYLAQVNPLRYGLPQNLAGIISAGGTNLEAVGTLVDVASWIRIQAAKLNEGAAAIQKQQLENELCFATLVQYALAQRQKSRIDAVLASLEKSEGLKKVAQARLEMGVGVKVDVMRAQALVSADRLKLLDAKNAYQKALRDLAALLGVEVITQELTPLEIHTIDPTLLKKLHDQNPEARRDVIYTSQQAHAASRLAEASQWDRFPKLRLFTEFGYFGSGTILGFGNGALNGTVALQISVPIFHGGSEQARQQQDRIQALRAELQASQVAIEAKSQHAYAVGQIEIAQQAVVAAREQLSAVQEEARLIRKRFEAGSASGMEVTNSYVALTAAVDQEIESIYAHEAARFTLHRSLGDFEGVQ